MLSRKCTVGYDRSRSSHNHSSSSSSRNNEWRGDADFGHEKNLCSFYSLNNEYYQTLPLLLGGGGNCETYRPSNLPPKSLEEIKAHSKQVQELEIRYGKAIQSMAVEKAVQQMKVEQKMVLMIDFVLWLFSYSVN